MQAVWTKEKALDLLKVALNNEQAYFRADQWEAIDSLVNQHKKILLVQRTGWGKSIVYFIGTRIIRDKGRGLTILISPLLALMRNQILMAERLGIRAVTMNSTNRADWEDIKEQIFADQIDVLLISPERLANDEFIQDILLPVGQRTGLLVVDEAHCISDWGHDFRPDYRRIVRILQQMPVNIPVVGTTATANNRVVRDIQEQLGDIEIMRGPLLRESLFLQNIRLPDQAARLAWLAEQVPQFNGTGIIYTLTKHDANRVAEWLQKNDINAVAYYSDVKHPDFANSDSYRQYLEERLYNNDIKALVATTALGMGYDKPDLGFVIHYQAPGSVIAYYQQVGRAGRAIEHAHGVLLSGKEDQEIHDYFRRSAFPDEFKVQQIIRTLEAADGLSVNELQKKINLRGPLIEHILKWLSIESPAPIIKDGGKWYRTAVNFELDHERITFLTRQKVAEWEEIQQYIDYHGCLMQLLRNALNDPGDTACGNCANCARDAALSTTFSQANGIAALDFLNRSEIILEPRTMIPKDAFPLYGLSGNLEKQGLSLEPGRILSRWGDAGWGEMVANNKHSGHFEDALVEGAVSMIRERWRPTPPPVWVTCVPSLNNPELVPDLARRISVKMGLPFLNIVAKIEHNDPQKLQNNSLFQCRNLDGVFVIDQEIPSDPVLLIDDIVDSRWTLTAVGALLRKAGCSLVYPLALATSAGG